MKKREAFNRKLNSDSYKWLVKNINKREYYSEDQFHDDCLRYVKAIKEGRVICSIDSVSRSGMSRNIKFLECSKGRDRYEYYNFWSFFKVLGYTETGKYSHLFRIHGCGMDMIFHTNYSNMAYMRSLGIINKKQESYLAQQTPTVI